RGTPYYYYGDELGMTNAKFDKIEDYRDIETLAEYEKVKIAGGDLHQFIENQKTGGARDNGRTPMQWDTSENAGFTTGTPWLAVNKNHDTINVATENENPDSVLNYFRNMVKLRKENLVLTYGSYQLLQAEHPDIYAYTRTLEDKKVLVLLNFKSTKASIQLAELKQLDKPIINNYGDFDIQDDSITLKPYQSLVLSLK
ncbi:MAG: alpha-glucosidase C-terminal domain-containing protein, partial [Aquaticitalea sp.]